MPLKKKKNIYNIADSTTTIRWHLCSPRWRSFFFSRPIPCCRSIEIDRRALEVGLERNYGAIENTFNATDRNSSAKGAKAPARIGLQWPPRTTRTSLPLGGEVHLQRKRSSHFQWPRPLYKVLLVSCRRFYSTALTREQKREMANSPCGGKTFGEMYQPLLHDERIESESLFMRDVHTIYNDFVPKWIDIFSPVARSTQLEATSGYNKFDHIKYIHPCKLSNKFLQ